MTVTVTDIRLPFLVLLAVLTVSCGKEPESRSDPESPKPWGKSIAYLTSIQGRQTVAGIHNREPNSNPVQWTDSITRIAGKAPGLWSGDFLFSASDVKERWTMIYEAERQWKKGSLVNIMWHTCSPKYTEPCAWNDGKGVLSKLTDTDWTSLITDGGTLNTVWKSRMDIIAPYLQYFENQGVEVLFRPFHEMNQGAFWWGGRPGETGTAALYRLTHDYFVKTKGLENLVWIWDLQDFGSLGSDLTAYSPGDSYWDILALDMYSSDGTGYTAAKYNLMVAASKGRPVVIGECEKLPTAAELKSQPKWGFFMSWSELTVQKNTAAQIAILYGASNVITLDEMPGW
ncbi:MAG: glycoside hydrolase family 26 protein [Bacteroidetes bacterium]|nr:glycoside hydrolase family 26 protein [Bacteroidota bacterium]